MPMAPVRRLLQYSRLSLYPISYAGGEFAELNIGLMSGQNLNDPNKHDDRVGAHQRGSYPMSL
jgi:hypothetical protein